MLGLILKYPKMIAIGLVVTVALGFFANYKYMQVKIDRLELEKASMTRALEITADSLRRKDAALQLEREATAILNAERDARQAALDAFTAGREDDPEAVAWGATPIPIGEVGRLCLALPEIAGCQNTATTN